MQDRGGGDHFPLRGVDQYLDAEAVRVVQSMPNFKPGKQRGKSVNVQYNIPINFTLDENKPVQKTNFSLGEHFFLIQKRYKEA